VSPLFDIRHGETVALVGDDDRGLKAGAKGKVLALRAEDGQAQYLVKWQGKAGPVSVWREQLTKA